ncbi:MAG: methylated-DNA--[protein]-cysteine S-methyltransferase [Actinomycetia bacterium]|nr:methylated-DNA--[protein]-cysteine S-methyltransferase [Actinomycetes bacterium]
METAWRWARFEWGGHSLFAVRSAAGLVQLTLPGEPFDEVTAFARRTAPGVRLVEDAAALAPWVDEVTAYLDGRRKTFHQPLDPRGTPFQLAVWEAIRAIPYGERRTYGQLALALGRPRASRAVGRATGQNPLPLVIPCHRVVARSGLGGYSDGLALKTWLLAQEAGLEAGALPSAAR